MARKLLGIVIAWEVIRTPSLSASDKLAYGALALSSRKLGFSKRSACELADLIGVSEGTIRSSLKALLEAGLVEQDVKGQAWKVKGSPKAKGLLVPHAIAQHDHLSASAKIVYALLEFRTRLNSDRFDQGKLAEAVQMPERTFRTAQKLLEKLKVIRVIASPGKRSRYRLADLETIETESKRLGNTKEVRRLKARSQFGKAVYDFQAETGDAKTPTNSHDAQSALPPLVGQVIPEPSPSAVAKALAEENRVQALRGLGLADAEVERILENSEYLQDVASQHVRSRALLETLAAECSSEIRVNRPGLGFEIADTVVEEFYRLLCRDLGERWNPRLTDSEIRMRSDLWQDLDTLVFNKVFRPAIKAWDAVHESVEPGSEDNSKADSR